MGQEDDIRKRRGKLYVGDRLSNTKRSKRDSCYQPITSFFPNRWKVEGVDNYGRTFVYPVNPEGQHREDEAKNLIDRLSRKGYKLSMYEESWDGESSSYRKVEKDG